ncbi:MAG TPA: glycosyltransferase family 4 protein, partial [Candidatus Eremiobacteraceae bacterium]|nr:glycosyltransferase family 4 protein [Candidatus Eremiobacteraceae bacterium]
RPDIVHTHMHNGKYWGRLAAVAAGVPHIVHTEHDPNFRMHGFERAAATILMHRTERFIAFSPGHRTRLASAEGIPFGKIAVIPNGIAFRPMPPDARERGRRLLGAARGELAIVMVGRLESQKNHELALRAFACLPEHLRGVARLHIIGAGSREASLRALANQLEIDPVVTFLGFRRDSLDLIAGGDAMLMTSQSEAMPIALIEGMSLALPVVSAPWLGAAEMLDGGDLGYVASSFAPEDVAFKLARALSEPQEAHAKAAAARAKALAEYDLRTAVARHHELYRTLVGTS